MSEQVSSFELLQSIQKNVCGQIRANMYDFSSLKLIKNEIQSDKYITLFNSEKIGIMEFIDKCIGILDSTTNENKIMLDILKGNMDHELLSHCLENLYFLQLYIEMLSVVI